MLKNIYTDQFILSSLTKRKEEGRYRELVVSGSGVDFFSNDYLGLARSSTLFERSHQLVKQYPGNFNGATGSRLLSGNSELFEQTEINIAKFHKAESALIFNSGYDANLGFFSTVPQKGDLIFYDEYIHASIRDGIRLSLADAYSFVHNSISSLQTKIQSVSLIKKDFKRIFIVVESIYSMDGDQAPLSALAEFCTEHNYLLITDEAHALGIYGNEGEGLVQSLGIESLFFARIYTYGKALGVHGASICGSTYLKEYLINFCRTFIYSTALSPHAIASIQCAYQQMITSNEERLILKNNAQYYASLLNDTSNIDSPIKSLILSGNKNVKHLANQLQGLGYEVRPILSPTVPENKERLRICLHSYNTQEEIKKLIQHIQEYIV